MTGTTPGRRAPVRSVMNVEPVWSRYDGGNLSLGSIHSSDRYRRVLTLSLTRPTVTSLVQG